MPGLLVVSHGRLAEELVASARTIVGDVEALAAVSIDWDVEVEEARRRVEAAIRDVDRGAGVLVLTDMFGGTPTNLALSLYEQGRIEIVTGVNLPMLIKGLGIREQADLHAMSVQVAEKGRDAIQVASSLLESRDGAGEDPR